MLNKTLRQCLFKLLKFYDTRPIKSICNFWKI